MIGLLAFTMSWREGMIVALAVPITYSLTLLCNYLLGLHDQPRHALRADPRAGPAGRRPDRGRGEHRAAPAHAAAAAPAGRRRAMNEIMPPIVLSTLAIIVAFTPMFFITGMMGPYMRPMALNVPMAVLMSTVVALTITPWLSSKLLRGRSRRSDEAPRRPGRRAIYRVYGGVIGPFVDSRREERRCCWWSWACSSSFSVVLALTGLVPLKMLPFDNKNEFQVVVDMPESTTLETTDAVVRELEDYLRTVPEVTDFTSTVGHGFAHGLQRAGPPLLPARRARTWPTSA